MSTTDPLLEKLLEANERLAGWYQAIDREWERLKQEYNARAGSPYGFTAHVTEMSQRAIASVKEDPKAAVFAILDEVADAFLTLPPEDRDIVNDFFADCRDLERAHRGYISAHAAARLRATSDVIWLWRGITIAGLAKGGTDCRDLILSLNDLWDAAKAMRQGGAQA